MDIVLSGEIWQASGTISDYVMKLPLIVRIHLQLFQPVCLLIDVSPSGPCDDYVIFFGNAQMIFLGQEEKMDSLRPAVPWFSMVFIHGFLWVKSGRTMLKKIDFGNS